MKQKKYILKDKKEFSYLVGYWLGDGSKIDGNFILAVKGGQKIEALVSKVSKCFGKVLWKYTNSQNCILSFSKSSFIKNLVEKEIIKPSIILEYPWDFLVGFLDSDGCVQYHRTKGSKHEGDFRFIQPYYINTNLEYLNLVCFILEKVNIPCRVKLVPGLSHIGKKVIIRGKEAAVNKEVYNLYISTAAGIYIFASKSVNITIDEEKRKRLRNYIDYYREKHLHQKLFISECFSGIQGEGTNIGRVQFFIRVAGCNMKCVGCDSSFAQNIKNTTQISIRDLIQLVKKSGLNSICLTGGEFTIYRNKAQALIAFLKELDYHLVLQTNGLIYDNAIFSLVDTAAMDIKTPCTGETSNLKILKFLKEKDEIKTLINNIEDYEYAFKINKLVKGRFVQILQPYNDFGKDTIPDLINKLRWLAEKVLKGKEEWCNIRVLPQEHVFIWGNKRGV